MKSLNLEEVKKYVEDNIGVFHKKRIESLDNLQLKKVLKRKNPYLFKAKNVLIAEEIIKGIVDAHISSNEETIFGDWLEGLAIYINERVFGGRKSGIQGVDLEFENEGIKYLVSIKSGPHWANSSQLKKLRADFKMAAKVLRTSNSKIKVVAVNGCCYGKDNSPDKGDYYKYCGQRFWEFISGDEDLYKRILEPLGNKAKAKNDEFLVSYSNMINRFTVEFSKDFCLPNGSINWPKLVEFNSKK